MEQRINEFKADPNTPLAIAVRHKESIIREILGSTRKHVVLIPGNHDLSEWKSDRRIHNVHNARFKYKGYNFVGYRFTRLEVSEEEEEEGLSHVRKLVQRRTILITHSPAFGTLDQDDGGRSIGSKPLSRLVKKLQLVLHLSGHVHDSFGYEGIAANGSYVHQKKFISIGLPSISSSKDDGATFVIIDPFDIARESV